MLTVRFYPGVPDMFDSTFQIQVAHFQPENIRVFCEGLFPRITLDLPRPDCIHQPACENADRGMAGTAAGLAPHTKYPGRENGNELASLCAEAVKRLTERAVVRSETYVLGSDEVTTSHTTQVLIQHT